MTPSDVPQMILITFDDAVNDENWELYQETLFPPSKKNPNGCPISGTFYISHEYTNYAMIQKMNNRGHEIAVHSITHRYARTHTRNQKEFGLGLLIYPSITAIAWIFFHVQHFEFSRSIIGPVLVRPLKSSNIELG